MSMFDISDPMWITVAASIVIPLMTFLLVSHSHDSRDASEIPWAPGKIPLLGHALSYRQDPSGFLLRACQSVGSIFQLNLAGKHMIIVAGREAQRQVAKAPERLMSARQAVADIGFEETLGTLNVHQGTDLHKGIIKGIWQRNATEQFMGWKSALQQALDAEVNGIHQPQEWFQLVRRVVLRATIDRMISPHFLQGNNNEFLEQFMEFQDHLEDVTAKAVVMPRWIAGPALLRPVRRQREELQLDITKQLNELLESSNPTGFWLAQMHPRYATKDIAEYMVGLLFAAHKNPAIGAAQSYLMLYENCSEEDREAVKNDARALLAASRDDWNMEDTTLRRLCLETLRLTAHSIGAVRTAQEDFTIEVATDDLKPRLYIIRKGTSVGLTHITPSLNMELWGHNASQFDLKTHSLESYRDEYKFTTFSHGVHKCPGQQLALVILQLTVALLLEGYDIKLPSTVPPLSFERATLAQREGPVMVEIQRRENK